MILGTLHLDGRPQAWQRAGRTKSGHSYTPPATLAYEQEIALAWRGPREFAGAVKVTIAVIENQRQNAGDLDNYVKCILDALNGVAWVDDKQVIAIDAKVHRKDSRPGLDVIVEGWETETPAAVVSFRQPALQLRRGRGR
jgi:crossover junction endodeoxyribonuclease RusA